MATISKLVCMLACGILLSLGVIAQPAGAEDKDVNNSQHSPRIGGMDGKPYDHVTRHDGSPGMKEQQDRHPGERIGGMDGKPYDHQKHEYEPGYAKGRTGAQYGESSAISH